MLIGGNHRDLITGGSGVDTLQGNVGDDILINGSTDHDENRNALEALVAAWSASDKSYLERVHLLSISGVSSASQFRLNTSTVHDDGVVDIVSGSTGLDWFFTNLANENPDDALDETVNDTQ